LTGVALYWACDNFTCIVTYTFHGDEGVADRQVYTVKLGGGSVGCSCCMSSFYCIYSMMMMMMMHRASLSLSLYIIDWCTSRDMSRENYKLS